MKEGTLEQDEVNKQLQKCDELISKISKYQPQMDEAKNFEDADILDFPILGLLEKEF